MSPAMKYILSFCILLLIAPQLFSQAQPVPKTYSKPVFMHYMPWFETPEFNGFWGWHWKMNTMDPDSILDPLTGKRQIATHFYPMIGPYASKDPDVVEYHLLLMKYGGLDGVLVNWYGVQGTNGDINSLLTNSNALIDQTDVVGLKFGLVLEDRFAASIHDTRANLAYAANNYFNRLNYYFHGPDDDPLMAIFGPVTFQNPSDWDSIMPYAGQDLEFLTLWYEKNDAGVHADGEYAWIYEIDSLNDFVPRLHNFYTNRAPNLNTAMAVAYPGFEDFYQEGGAGNGFFTIPHDSGQVLDTTLHLVTQYDSVIDLLQLATWNDFGEGTMFEPTWEFGFSFLVQLQQFLGVPYGEYELQQIHRLYTLRKQYALDSLVQLQLDSVFGHFVALEVGNAVDLMDAIEGIVGVDAEPFSRLYLFPNPTADQVELVGHLPAGTRLVLYNGMGQGRAVEMNGRRIDLSECPAGLYWLKVETELTSQTLTILKQ